jgi:hypothetical protein
LIALKEGGDMHIDWRKGAISDGATESVSEGEARIKI